MKELLFSITKKDFDWTYYRSSGAGGQHRNTTDSSVRCSHKPSGAVGTASEEREQSRNKQMAFKRCVESKQFQLWLKLKSSEMMMEESIDSKIDKALNKNNIKTEIKNEKGQWIQVDFDEYNLGVHKSHCCLIHGCKYNDDDCPVVLCKVEQDFPCEDCE